MHRPIQSAPLSPSASSLRLAGAETPVDASADFLATLRTATESADAAASDPKVAAARRRSGVVSSIAGGTPRSRSVTQTCVREQRERGEHSLATQRAETALATAAPSAPSGFEPAVAPAANDGAADRAASNGDSKERDAASPDRTPSRESTARTDAASSTPVASTPVATTSGESPNTSEHARETAPGAERLRAVAGSTTAASRVQATVAAPIASVASVSNIRAASREVGSTGPILISTRATATRPGGANAAPAKCSMPRTVAEEPTMMLRAGKALAAALKGEGDLKLNLSPEELGRLQVRMSTDQEGLSIQLACERPESAATLESGKESLRRSLESQGVRVKGIDVQVVGDAATAAAAASPLIVGEEQSRPRSGGEQPRRDIPAPPIGAKYARDGGDEEAESLIEAPISLGTALALVGTEGVTGALDTVV